VYGTLVPQIRSMLFPPLSFRLAPHPIGESRSPTYHLRRWSSATWQSAWSFLLVLVRPLTILWERFLLRQILKIVSAPAFGLPIHEFSNGLVTVRERLDAPKFFKERHWNVGKILISSSARQRLGSDKTRRYDFLWGEAEFQKRRGASWLWSQMSESLSELRRRYKNYPQINIDKKTTRISMTCVALEERFKEMAGLVELLHAGYYSNAEVIAGIGTVDTTMIAAAQRPSDDTEQSAKVLTSHAPITCCRASSGATCT
jgi:hypothetical protein